MGCWGRGLMQSDNDYDVADNLVGMMGVKVFFPDPGEKDEIVIKLNDGLLAQWFDTIMSPEYTLPAGFGPYHTKDRHLVVLCILAMEIGANIEKRHLDAVRAIRPKLPNMFQQLQLQTALDEYKNDGTRWVLGSKGLMDTMTTSGRRIKYDLGDEFIFSGLGNSEDESPCGDTVSKKCLACGKDDANLLRCSRCNMARYCSKPCQEADYPTHRTVCQSSAPRSCHVPKMNPDGTLDVEADAAIPKPESSPRPRGPQFIVGNIPLPGGGGFPF